MGSRRPAFQKEKFYDFLFSIFHRDFTHNLETYGLFPLNQWPILHPMRGSGCGNVIDCNPGFISRTVEVLMDTPVKAHPARYSKELVQPIAEMLIGCTLIIDPFAGTGERLADMAKLAGCRATGIEIEPEFIVRWDVVGQGDATNLLFPNGYFDGATSSPTYGNRMNDNYQGNSRWKYYTYRSFLGRELSQGSTAGVKFGKEYIRLHYLAWQELYRVLRPGSPFVLNIKDSWQGNDIIPVSQWHYETLKTIGFTPVKVVRVPVKGMRNGANGNKRIGCENLILFER